MNVFRLTPIAALLLATACVDNSGGTSTTTTIINFGDNTSEWANDGECDDPRFRGPASATTLLPVDTGRDARDCKDLFEKGFVAYIG